MFNRFVIFVFQAARFYTEHFEHLPTGQPVHAVQHTLGVGEGKPGGEVGVD